MKTAADRDHPSRSVYLTLSRVWWREVHGDETVSVVRLKRVVEESY